MDITRAFLEGVINCEQYQEALDIVKLNSSGKIWLIGGFVYRTIASQIYSSAMPEVDLDFIVESSALMVNLPKGWVKDFNKFGNPKFVNGEKHIDYVPLNNIYSIIKRKLEPSIENFLSGVPLTIQSIAYDVYANQVIGEKGISSLQRKVVEVNDFEFAEYAAKKKGISLNEMIRKKAESLEFEYVLPTIPNS